MSFDDRLNEAIKKNTVIDPNDYLMPENQRLTENLKPHQHPNFNLKTLDNATQKQVFDDQNGRCFQCKKSAIQYIMKVKSTTTGLFKFLGMCGNCLPENIKFMKA